MSDESNPPMEYRVCKNGSVFGENIMPLSLKPQQVTEHMWYYEEKKGINVIHEILDDNLQHIRTDQIVIPWEKIRASLKREDSEST